MQLLTPLPLLPRRPSSASPHHRRTPCCRRRHPLWPAALLTPALDNGGLPGGGGDPGPADRHAPLALGRAPVAGAGRRPGAGRDGAALQVGVWGGAKVALQWRTELLHQWQGTDMCVQLRPSTSPPHTPCLLARPEQDPEARPRIPGGQGHAAAADAAAAPHAVGPGDCVPPKHSELQSECAVPPIAAHLRSIFTPPPSFLLPCRTPAGATRATSTGPSAASTAAAATGKRARCRMGLF